MAELDSQPKTLQSVYGWYAADKLHVNRRYQRKLVWTLLEKQKLVSSVLHAYPIPAVLLAERDGEYEIIDGLQRLHTLMSFIDTSFPDERAQYFRVSEFATARRRRDSGNFSLPVGVSELDPADVASYLDYPLSISIMRDAVEADIDEVFSRINTFGHRLSDQERRQAGVQTDFAGMVRETATQLRGDASANVLNLSEMPQISIDLPKMKHGYSVQADEVMWVKQGILRAGDLRDSLDEQCIADIMASIVGASIIERSKDALDRIYDIEDPESARITRALDGYGADKLVEEFKHCAEEIVRVVDSEPPHGLANLIGVKNPFPSVFAIVIIAFHEVLIGEEKKISSVAGVRGAFKGLYSRLNTSRSSTVPSERRKNVDTVKGMIADQVVSGSIASVYANAGNIDVEALIRRSSIEVPRYELKQGAYDLSNERQLRKEVMEKVVRTICGIANCGPDADGVILIGIADKEADAKRIERLDGVESRKVGDRWVVGVAREARLAGMTTEAWVGLWKGAIRESDLSDALKGSVLASMDYNDFHGLGVLIIRIPRQSSPSFVGQGLFVREGDETILVTDAPTIAGVVERFRHVSALRGQ